MHGVCTFTLATDSLNLTLDLASCIDCLPVSGGRNHSSTPFSQTFIPLKYCSMSRSSCRYKMCVIFSLEDVSLMLPARNNRCQRLLRKYTSSLGGMTSGSIYTGTFYDNGIKMLSMRFIPSSGASQVGVPIPNRFSSQPIPRLRPTFDTRGTARNHIHRSER